MHSRFPLYGLAALLLAGCDSNTDAPTAPPSVIVSDMEKSAGAAPARGRAKVPAAPASAE